MKKIEIHIDDKVHEMALGLTKGVDLNKVSDLAEGAQLVFVRRDQTKVPVSDSDFLVLRGEERFQTGGKGEIEDNPQERKANSVILNGKTVSDGNALMHPKVDGGILKSLDNELGANCRLFLKLPGPLDSEIKDDQRLIIQPEDEFLTIPASEDENGEEIDVALCCKMDRCPPRHVKYRIAIGKEKYTVDQKEITGAEILGLAKLSPDQYMLNQKFKGGKRETIKPEQIVDLTAPGIERFEVIPLQADQGSTENCGLLEEDIEYLKAEFPDRWEVKTEPHSVIVSSIQLPAGYEPDHADLMILVPPNYPGAVPDMFYLNPAISRADKKNIDATEVTENHHQRKWQRWSRHHPKDELNIAEQIQYALNVLQRESSYSIK